MMQLQGQKWPLTTFMYFLGLLKFSYLGSNLQNYFALTGDAESLDVGTLCGPANLTFLTGKISRVFFSLPGPTEFFQTSVLLLVAFNVKQFKDNTYVRHHCDKRMCYKKRQCLGASVFKTILHEGKAIFSTKQTNITKQVQWYFYILEIF